jgi:hypothetical protein
VSRHFSLILDEKRFFPIYHCKNQTEFSNFCKRFFPNERYFGEKQRLKQANPPETSEPEEKVKNRTGQAQ